MIRFNNVSKRYLDSTYAVKSVNFQIHEGELMVLIGPSGCGKTTTLKMINRLIPATDGTITIGGQNISQYDIHQLRWDIGYVLQEIALFPHMTIEENIAIVPELKKWNGKRISQRIDELLQMIGLDPETYRHRKPNELSGGQQQRVGVARALAANPKIILMDEPFSALDPVSREKLQDDLLELQRTIKKTIVFVTHDMREALKLADRICVMRDGEVVQIATPQELLNHPANDFVRNFVGEDMALATAPFSIQKYIQYNEMASSTVAKTIPPHASLQEILTLLTEYDQLGVLKDGRIIGTINRQGIIQHLAEQMGKEGRLNG
ncbi:ABC transporter ATP-binding protein [Peribacillus sp. SCS-155]|uniref:ABC transporter ATP-binding protein n=1 Tax=Peribacillus sedimenti TaxID=3115297 RepID=UPI0039063129